MDPHRKPAKDFQPRLKLLATFNSLAPPRRIKDLALQSREASRPSVSFGSYRHLCPDA